MCFSIKQTLYACLVKGYKRTSVPDLFFRLIRGTTSLYESNVRKKPPKGFRYISAYIL
jgi:hypothetical protein